MLGKEIYKAHPVMFRAHPFWFILSDMPRMRAVKVQTWPFWFSFGTDTNGIYF